MGIGGEWRRWTHRCLRNEVAGLSALKNRSLSCGKKVLRWLSCPVKQARSIAQEATEITVSHSEFSLRRWKPNECAWVINFWCPKTVFKRLQASKYRELRARLDLHRHTDAQSSRSKCNHSRWFGMRMIFRCGDASLQCGRAIERQNQKNQQWIKAINK